MLIGYFLTKINLIINLMFVEVWITLPADIGSNYSLLSISIVIILESKCKILWEYRVVYIILLYKHWKYLINDEWYGHDHFPSTYI